MNRPNKKKYEEEMEELQKLIRAKEAEIVSSIAVIFNVNPYLVKNHKVVESIISIWEKNHSFFLDGRSFRICMS
jgi:hypothetical protein